jgi:predicted choloylglycine hydrolase
MKINLSKHGYQGLLIISLLLTGCASQETPAVVKVPVAVSCPIPVLPKAPHLPIATLKPDSSPAEVMKAYAVSIELLQQYSHHLRTILLGYQKPSVGSS